MNEKNDIIDIIYYHLFPDCQFLKIDLSYLNFDLRIEKDNSNQ